MPFTSATTVCANEARNKRARFATTLAKILELNPFLPTASPPGALLAAQHGPYTAKQGDLFGAFSFGKQNNRRHQLTEGQEKGPQPRHRSSMLARRIHPRPAHMPGLQRRSFRCAHSRAAFKVRHQRIAHKDQRAARVAQPQGQIIILVI